jgi:hypothetical protein
MEINFDFNRYDKISGVYFIQCIKNNKIYIGSSNNILTRLECHRSELRGNYHGNCYLQNSWNKHGEKNFIVGILEKVDDIDALLNREQYYIDKLKPELNLCFNVRRHSFSEESKKRLSNKRKELFRNGKLKPSVVRPVSMYDCFGNFIRKYESISSAARDIGAHVSSVERCVYRTSKQAKGFTFRYENDKSKVGVSNKKGHIIKMIDTLNSSEMIFLSVSKCCEHFNVGPCNYSILKSIKNKKLYKERFALYKLDELLENPGEDNQQPSTPLTKCEGSTTNS